MANQEHIDLINQGITVWNAWRPDHPDLSGANLNGASLFRANLSGANLSDADLSNSIFSRTILNNSRLAGARLTGARFRSAHLRSAVLSKADLSNVKFIDADLSSARLIGAILTGAVFNDAKLDNANLSGTDLSGVNLKVAKSIQGMHLCNVKGLTQVQLEDYETRGAIIDKASTVRSSQSIVASASSPQSNDGQVSSTPPAQGSPTTPDADVSSATSSTNS